MNRRTRVLRALLLGSAVGGLMLGSLPAQAASASWEDPAGDAKQSGAEPLGAPEVLSSNPVMDITKVTISSDGAALGYEVAVPEMAEGNPHATYTYLFRLYFTVGESEFHFRVGESPLGEPVFTFRDPDGAVTDCKDCTGTIDREAKRVVVKAPLAAISAAFKAAEVADSAAGQSITAGEVLAQRDMAGQITLTADTATAPEGFSLTI